MRGDLGAAPWVEMLSAVRIRSKKDDLFCIWKGLIGFGWCTVYMHLGWWTWHLNWIELNWNGIHENSHTNFFVTTSLLDIEKKTYLKYQRSFDQEDICRKIAAHMATSAMPLVGLALWDQSIYGPWICSYYHMSPRINRHALEGFLAVLTGSAL